MHFSFWIIIYLVASQQQHKWSASCLVNEVHKIYIVYKRHYIIHTYTNRPNAMIFYVLEDCKNCNDTRGTHRHKPYADNLVDYYTRKT